MSVTPTFKKKNTFKKYIIVRLQTMFVAVKIIAFSSRVYIYYYYYIMNNYLKLRNYIILITTYITLTRVKYLGHQ